MNLAHLVKRTRALADAGPHFYTDAEILTCIGAARAELCVKVPAVYREAFWKDWEDLVIEHAAHKVIALIRAMDAQNSAPGAARSGNAGADDSKDIPAEGERSDEVE